jgi:GntR family transcriptional regulator / MocR family aminotransferase
MRNLLAAFLSPITRSASAKVPIYQQLYECFRKAIVDGQIRPGQRVPSTRNLALELGVSRVPVVSAYEQLLAEGYFEALIGAGTYVSRSIPVETLHSAAGSPRKSLPRSDEARSLRQVARLASAASHTTSPLWLHHNGAFRVSQPALDHFPDHIWSKLLARHSRKPPAETMAYGDPKGYLPLREAVADYVRAIRGVRCESSQILITNGSQQALQIAARVLLEAGDPVCVEEPGYSGAHQVFLSAGARLIPVSVDQDGLDTAELIDRTPKPRLLYVTPSHQYPLGTTLSAGRRVALLHWAERSGVWIIEDDYDSEYRFGSRPITSLQGLDPSARVIYIGTFSKVMFPALRLGYVVVPSDLMPTFAAAREAADMFSCTLYQAALTEFIRGGHFGRHIRRMRLLYAKRRTALQEALRTQIGDVFEVIGAEAGMHLVGLLPSHIDDVALAERVARQGISAMPLSSCYLKSPKRRGLVLGYGSASSEQLQEGVLKLKACLEGNA